jgi:putative heme transporter
MAEPGTRPERDQETARTESVTASGDGIPFRLPEWFQTVGRGAWLAVGIALTVAIAAAFAGLISDLLIPLIFAAILAAIFVPFVDRLERIGIPRSLGASLVVVLALVIVVAVVWMVVVAVFGTGADIVDQVTAGVNEAGSVVDASDAGVERTTEALGNVVKVLVEGVLRGLGSVTVLVVGMVTGMFILLYLMKDWDLVFAWTSHKLARFLGLPEAVGEQILTETSTSFRSYATGLTIIGVMNAVVVGGGLSYSMCRRRVR